MSNDWNAVIQADLKDAEYTPRSPVADGDYEATVTNITAKTFKRGSKGLEITFTIQTEGEYKGRELKDYMVIYLADGSVNKSGAAITKKLLVEGGLDLKAINNFKFPDYDSKAFGDFKKLLDQPFMIEVKGRPDKTGPNAGKIFARIMTFKQAA